MTVPFTPLYINGCYVPASDNATYEVRNPYTELVVGTAAAATSKDCAAAIEAAAKAFESWENTSLSERRDIFLKAAELIPGDKYRNKIAEAIQQETSTDPALSLAFNWRQLSDFIRTHILKMDQLKGETFPSGSVPGAQVVIQPRAMGVCLAIPPWNAPAFLTLRAIVAPLLAGNTVVLKTSEVSPRSQSVVVELFEDAGLPAGVMNMISMSRESSPALTAEIIAHSEVRHINFTGGDRVGKILAMEAAKYLKPCVLELGGKAPAIVLNDANVAEAAKALVFGAMLHSGQICISTERIIVQRGVADELIARVKTLSQNIKAGDQVNDPSTANLGPLFNESSAANIIGMIKEAKEEGAEVVLGDITHKRAILQPHIIKNVNPNMRLWKRETFGPVVVFAVVDTVDEAVTMANASEYSLSASVWSGDFHAAQRIASRIRSGFITLNGPTVHLEPSDRLLGLGGASGYGSFEIDNFMNKRVTVAYPNVEGHYPLVG